MGVVNQPASYHLETIKQLSEETEAWRLSLPDNGFRPGGAETPYRVQGRVDRQLAVFVHYLYANLVLTISRAKLHHLRKKMEPSSAAVAVAVAEQKQTSELIMSMSRSILELTSVIEVEPYTNIW